LSRHRDRVVQGPARPMTSTSDRSSIRPDRAIEQVSRAEWGRPMSLLMARTRRLDLAEDALSEDFVRASARWSREGVPANPAGWLYATAYGHVVGRLRAEAIAGRKAPLLAVGPGWVPPAESREELADDRLHLIRLCCHPAAPARVTFSAGAPPRDRDTDRADSPPVPCATRRWRRARLGRGRRS
jgi:hypothetical protein